MVHLLAASGLIHVSTQLLAVVSGVVIPMLVSVLAKERASDAVKAILNAGLCAIAGGVSGALTAGGDIVWQSTLESIGVTWVTAIGTYYGFWKPTGIAGNLSSATSMFGFGKPAPESSYGAERTAKAVAKAEKRTGVAPKTEA